MKSQGFALSLFISGMIPCLFAAAGASQPKPAVLSAKSISFITFATGDDAKKLKQQFVDYFDKWKRYQVLDDPAHADLIVLAGPMPNHVDSDDWNAVLSGKPAAVPVDTRNAASQFAVFDGAEVHGDAATGPMKPIWSTEVKDGDFKAAARKYKQLVENTQESYDHLGLTFEKCRMVGLRCSH